MLIEYSPHASGSGPRKSRLVAHREALLISRLRVQLIGTYCSRRDSTNWASREMLRHWSQRARQRQRQQSLSLHTDRYIQHSVSMQASPPLFLHSLRSRTESPHAWQFATARISFTVAAFPTRRPIDESRLYRDGNSSEPTRRC